MSAGENLLREIFQAPPVERLQAAIEKLERLKGASTPGPWDAEIDPDEGTLELNGGSARTVWQNGIGTRAGSWRSTDRIIDRDDLWENTDIERAGADADLIVTLHRTIDAQLAILREALFQLEGSPDLAGFIGNELTLFMRLADAILGGDS